MATTANNVMRVTNYREAIEALIAGEDILGADYLALPRRFNSVPNIDPEQAYSPVRLFVICDAAEWAALDDPESTLYMGVGVACQQFLEAAAAGGDVPVSASSEACGLPLGEALDKIARRIASDADCRIGLMRAGGKLPASTGNVAS